MSSLYLGRREVRKGKRGEKEFAKYLEQVFQHEDVDVWNNPLNFEGVCRALSQNLVPYGFIFPRAHGHSQKFGRDLQFFFQNSIRSFKKVRDGEISGYR